jgi:hypothetical protein
MSAWRMRRQSFISARDDDIFLDAFVAVCWSKTVASSREDDFVILRSALFADECKDGFDG